MGSIKNTTLSDDEQVHTLTDEEFNYVMNVNAAKQNIVQEYNRVCSAFLKYICSSRLGYKPEADLQFELDFADKKHELHVKVIKL